MEFFAISISSQRKNERGLAMTKTSPLKDKVILVVDDEPDVLETVEEELDMCLVHKAQDYDMARQYLASYTYDVVILDIMGVNGYGLLEIANKMDIPAVMLTAHAFTPGNLLRSVKEGADSYLPKEEMGNIAIFLNDILEAIQEGKTPGNPGRISCPPPTLKRDGAPCQKTRPRTSGNNSRPVLREEKQVNFRLVFT